MWEWAVSRRGALEEERRVLEERLWPAGGRSGRWPGLAERELISHCTVANPVAYTVAYSIPHNKMLSCAAFSCLGAAQWVIISAGSRSIEFNYSF